MLLPDISCALCGGEVTEANHQPLWKSRFCTIYAPHKNSASASLSRRGQRLQTVDDTISIISPEEQQIDVVITLMRCSWRTSNPFVPYDANTDTSAWGFPFHCSCWELLKATSPTKDVNVQSLFDLCRSFPVLSGSLDFGHDYGGLYCRRHYHGFYPPFPGEETRLSGKCNTSNPIYQDHFLDPMDISFLGKIVEDREPLRNSPSPPPSIPKIEFADDPFGILPVEIIQCIFPYLASADVLNLKLSSHVVAHTPLPDRFWHSRFCHGREFDYMFEFARHSKYKGQWKKVFLLIRQRRNHPFFANRRRIWALATGPHGLHDLLSQTGTCHGTALRSWFEQDAPLDLRAWVTASRNLNPYGNDFSRGSRSLHERYLAFPEILSSISVSVVDLFTGRYVSGARVSDTDGTVLDLGYFEPHSSITFTTTRILGFLLAQDQRGIRGIKVLSESGRTSEWIGESRDLPRRRLVLPKTTEMGENFVKYIKGGFDACKMVSLAVSGHVGSFDYPDSSDSSNDPNFDLCLQDAAIWFPDIPHSGISFFGVPEQRKSDLSQARPLRVAMFSDVTGSHLPHVIGIKLWGAVHGRFHSLQIDLDEPLHGQTKVYLGATDSRLGMINGHSFYLDSAEGERIIGLDVNYIRHDVIISIQVYEILATTHNGISNAN
ncbi:hypothetical protein NUW58_g2060 [Xylaria curta]|uniref:Uncharacterized protein n=1 Tax=Xylaria curta TaxID=42375 RepID=A0ACC1PK73_9PEZI|nr:hypothetical protein NUW58_g2060 [Xylaria curta]